jgi:enoyl-CoA hydratase/carnithine racemase
MKTKNAHVQASLDGPIARIRLANPTKRNSLTSCDIGVFMEHLRDVARQPQVRVLIVAGGDGDTFCAGASLDQLSSGELRAEDFEQLTDRLTGMAVPTICAMNGHAFGGGAEIGMCCDFRIGARGMRLFVPPARFGLVYPVRGIERYVQRLGLDTAKRLLVASEEMDGEKLLALGYLTELVESDQVDAAAERLASRIAGLAPLAVTAMKEICNSVAADSLDGQRATDLADRCRQSQDLQEGLQAVREKRRPVFRGD